VVADKRDSIYVVADVRVPVLAQRIVSALAAHPRNHNMVGRYNDNRTKVLIQIKSSASLRTIPWANTPTVGDTFRVMTETEMRRYLLNNPDEWNLSDGVLPPARP
jgi:hypothetical protein